MRHACCRNKIKIIQNQLLINFYTAQVSLKTVYIMPLVVRIKTSLNQIQLSTMMRTTFFSLSAALDSQGRAFKWV